MTLRILDLLAEDEEQLEELYLDVNFRIGDNVLYMYRERFRLSEVIVRLCELESQGLLRSKWMDSHAEQCGPAGRFYQISDRGREVADAQLARRGDLYELADDPAK